MTTNASYESILTPREKRQLRDGIFRGHEFIGVDLAGADLRGALFENTSLERCSLVCADLRGARFIRCNLRNVLMTDAKLGENRFHGTIFHEVVGLSDESRAAVVREGGLFRSAGGNAR